MKLKDVCEINMGQSPESEYYNDKAQGLPFFQGNADFGELYPSVRIWCSEPKKIAQVGDILMSVRAPIGAMNIANVVCCIGRGLASIKVRDIAFLKYIWYALKSKVEELQSKGTGSTFKAINKAVLEELEISVPSIEEQKRIADELDKVSGLIEKRQKQLEKLDLLIKSRFVEMFGDPLKNEKKWEKAKLKDICNKIGDGLHGTPNYDDKGEYFFINGNNLENGEIRIYKETKKVNRSEFEKHKIDLSVNSILLSINGTLGKLAYYREEPVVLGKSVCFLDIKGNYNKIFAYHIMRSESFQQYINQNSTQSTIRNVGLKDLREITIINPQLQIQNQFADFVEKVEQNKSKVKNSLDKLITLKKALMQKYFG